jgi:hypothetical protein
LIDYWGSNTHVGRDRRWRIGRYWSNINRRDGCWINDWLWSHRRIGRHWNHGRAEIPVPVAAVATAAAIAAVAGTAVATAAAIAPVA